MSHSGTAHICLKWPVSLWGSIKLLPQSKEILTLSSVTKGETLGILKIGENKLHTFT